MVIVPTIGVKGDSGTGGHPGEPAAKGRMGKQDLSPESGHNTKQEG